MKNKLLLVAIAKLLKVDEKVIVEASEKEDGDDSIIQDYLKKYNAYSAEEIQRMVKNANEKFLETADFDINKVPDGLYRKIKGSVLESTEKKLAKEHGIDSYTGLNDLISKLTAKNNDGKGTNDEALTKQIETLKQTVAEKEQAIKEVEEKYTSTEINREFSSALSSLPLDAEEEALPKQRELLAAAFTQKHKLGKKGETVIVSDEKGILVDKLGDPQKVTDVLKTVAESYGFKFKQADQGGRGQGSSTGGNPTNTSLKGKPWAEALAESKFAPYSDASDALHKEWKAANNS